MVVVKTNPQQTNMEISMNKPKPTVVLLSTPALTQEFADMIANIQQRRPDHLTGTPCEVLAEYAGRICYDSAGKANARASEAYHENIAESRHWSVWRHCTLVFEIRDISRNCSHEWVRHHVGTGISQESHRYVDVTRKQIASHPVLDCVSDDLKQTIAYHEAGSRILYTAIVEDLASKGYNRKEARGAASRVLPHGWQTCFVWSANLEAIRTIILARDSDHADAEIRELAQIMRATLETQAPALLRALVASAG